MTVSILMRTVMANFPVVYASQDTLLLAEPQYDWWWYWSSEDFDEKANIHRFDISILANRIHGDWRCTRLCLRTIPCQNTTIMFA